MGEACFRFGMYLDRAIYFTIDSGSNTCGGASGY